MTVIWVLAPCSLVEVTNVSEVLAAFIIRAMMEATGTSEMSVNFYQTTWHYNPEDNHLHSRCCENLKSYLGREMS
jgi:hypothetical protein